MNTDMNGKSIDFIDLNPAWTQHGNPERIPAAIGITIALSATYHGDHDEFWIVVSDASGEIGRYNPRGVQHIRWSRPSAGPKP